MLAVEWLKRPFTPRGCFLGRARRSIEARRCLPPKPPPGFNPLKSFVSRRGALPATCDALWRLGGGLLPELPYHRPQRGWHPTRAPAPQRSRRIVEEVPGSRTRRGQRARVERTTARPPLAAPSLGAAPGVPLRRAPVASLPSTSDPRAREPRWASSSASAATASRRRPTTASRRRCRPLTSRYECGVPLFADFIGTRRLRESVCRVFFSPDLTETRPAGEGHSSAVAHVQEAR